MGQNRTGMRKFELPDVIPAPGNPFSIANMDTGAVVAPSLDTITPVERNSCSDQAVISDCSVATTEPGTVIEPSVATTTMAQLLESMQQAEVCFKQALQMAMMTRSQEHELLRRAEEAERESRFHQHQAEEWQARYQVLDHKIPRWVRKLFRAS